MWCGTSPARNQTHSVMSGGLVKRTIPSALLSKPSTTASPHTTMLPETAARPVSMTIPAFLTTSCWDPRQTLADSTLDNVAGEQRSANLRRTLRSHCKGGVRPHIRVGRVFGISFSTQGEACPSQIEGVCCEPGTDILVYPLSATSRCSETSVATTIFTNSSE